jgi:ATP-dependent exoDNAse (exonuclease V) beta subunit
MTSAYLSDRSESWKPGIGYMPHQYNTPEEEAWLLYVAMTRAIEQLILTCFGVARRRHRSSEFTTRLETVFREGDNQSKIKRENFERRRSPS